MTKYQYNLQMKDLSEDLGRIKGKYNPELYDFYKKAAEGFKKRLSELTGPEMSEEISAQEKEIYKRYKADVEYGKA